MRPRSTTSRALLLYRAALPETRECRHSFSPRTGKIGRPKGGQMDEILQQLVDQLGTHPGQAEVGAGALLNLIREHASAADFGQLPQVVPEASKWMGTATAAQAGTAPGDGGLLGELGGVVGGVSGPSRGGGGPPSPPGP